MEILQHTTHLVQHPLENEDEDENEHTYNQHNIAILFPISAYECECSLYSDMIRCEVISRVVDQLLDNTNIPIFSASYNKVLNIMQSNGADLHMIFDTLNAINARTYDWYLGAIFSPWLFSSDTTCHTWLSPYQVHDAYCTLYRLIHFYGVNHDVVDYYNMSYFTQIKYLRNRKANNMPAYIHRALSQFYNLLKHGPRLILLQEALMRKFILRKRQEKRKQAYNVIASWWFEIVNNPDTTVGKRMLQRRIDRFHALISCQSESRTKHAH